MSLYWDVSDQENYDALAEWECRECIDGCSDDCKCWCHVPDEPIGKPDTIEMDPLYWEETGREAA